MTTSAHTPPPSTSPSTPTAPLRPVRRMPVWARWVIGVCVVVVGVPLAFAAVVVWSFSGGWDGIRPQPEAGDRQVVRARGASRAPLDRLTAATLPTVGGTELTRARVDECQEGQNNWKIHDGYKLRCERSDLVVVAVADLDGTDGVQRLADRLRAGRLTPVHDSAALGANGSDHGVYAAEGDGTGSVEVTLVRRPAESYQDPLLRRDPRDVQGDAAGVSAALAQPGGSVVLLRTTVRYYDS